MQRLLLVMFMLLHPSIGMDTTLPDLHSINHQTNRSVTPTVKPKDGDAWLAQRLEWMAKIAKCANPYFSDGYTDLGLNKEFDKLECPDGIIVLRQNHALNHGITQSYLGVDLIRSLMRTKNLAGAVDFQGWLRKKLKEDKGFIKKAEFANAFQRSGRKSELSREANPQVYEGYLKADQHNFLESVKVLTAQETPFENEEAVNLFKDALIAVFQAPEEHPTDLYYLSKIFYVPHLLHLRRLPNFDKTRILDKITNQLFYKKTFAAAEPIEQDFILGLWDQTGAYLKASGERDIDHPSRQDWDRKVFGEQAKDPEKMILALEAAREKLEQRLLESIMNHTRMIRVQRNKHAQEQNLRDAQTQHKKAVSQYIREQEPELPGEDKKEHKARIDHRKSKVRELEVCLERAPYTASEAYLKIYLGDQYEEIPRYADYNETRRIITKNYRLFLSDPRRIPNPDDEYLNGMVQYMMEERNNPGKVALVHSTEPEMGFWYDVFTDVLNQLLMHGDNEMRALRIIDEAFLRLEEEVQKAQSPGEAKRRARAMDLMRVLHAVGDIDADYQAMGMATNFALPGSDLQNSSDTYKMHYHVKDIEIGARILPYENFLKYIKSQLGLELDYGQFKKILDRHVLTRNGQPCRNGRLIQIFIDPAVLSDIVYPSVIFGHPIKINDQAVPEFSELIKELRTKPTTFRDYIKNMTGSPARRANLILEDLQARVFWRPDVVRNSELFTIKPRWRLGPPDNLEEYYSSIQRKVSRSLIGWFKAGAPANPTALIPQTLKLKGFVQVVYKGSTGADAPKAPPITPEMQVVQLLREEHYEAVAELIKKNHTRFLTSQFQVPPENGYKALQSYDLKGLFVAHPKDVLLRLGFHQGIFKGGDNGFAIVQLFSLENARAEILIAIDQLKHPEKSCGQFLTYRSFDKFLPARMVIDLLRAYEVIEHDESIINIAKPLVNRVNGLYADKILTELHQALETQRQAVANETLSIVDDFSRTTIANILKIVRETQHIDPEKRKLMWSVVKGIGGDPMSMRYRIDLIDGLQKLDINMLTTLVERVNNTTNNARSKWIEVLDVLLKTPNLNAEQFKNKFELIAPYVEQHIPEQGRQRLKDYWDMIKWVIKNLEEVALEKREWVLQTMNQLKGSYGVLNLPQTIWALGKLNDSSNLQQLNNLIAEGIMGQGNSNFRDVLYTFSTIGLNDTTIKIVRQFPNLFEPDLGISNCLYLLTGLKMDEVSRIFNVLNERYSKNKFTNEDLPEQIDQIKKEVLQYSEQVDQIRQEVLQYEEPGVAR